MAGGPLNPWAKRLRAAAWIGGVLGAVLLVLGLIAAIRLASIGGQLQDARGLIENADAEIKDGRLAEARDHLTQAQNILTKANTRLYTSPELDVMSWTPIIGTNIDAIRDSLAKGLVLVNGGSRILGITEPFESETGTLEIPLRAGQIPLAAIQEAQREVTDLVTLLPGSSERPSGSFLFGPVKQMQNTVYQRASERRAELQNVSRALTLLADMGGAATSRRYLIAVANTAEMRGSGGMILSYGLLTSNAGKFELAHFGPIDELALSKPLDPAKVGLPVDYFRRWETLSPTSSWRDANVGPDFGISAPLMEAMFAAGTGLDLDGVIQVDPAGLAAILKGIGPVDVDGVGTVTAENVVDLTLNKAYTDFPDRDQRQEVTGDVAETVFRKLLTGEFGSMRALGGALVRAAAERHVLFYANSASSADVLRHFSADGALPSPDAQDYVILTAANFAGNKLDYYVDTSLQLTGSRPEAAVGEVTAKITVANTAQPDGTTPYVFGPINPDFERGQYRTLVSLYLPTGATVNQVGGSPTRDGISNGAEGGRSYVSFSLDLQAGESAEVTLDLTLPPRPEGGYSLTLVPMPRVRPTVVGVDLDLGDGQSVRRDPAPLVEQTTIRVDGQE